MLTATPNCDIMHKLSKNRWQQNKNRLRNNFTLTIDINIMNVIQLKCCENVRNHE